ncbi:hypothetical protein [Massilia sp. YMA4]|uniref:hypothetical protein n=1 Tax=Massilia sp. YMA4 TaxID=1593482 RepID=UPI00158363B0|nr:hypothetical protein [Massilia sp. YMA4]
MTDEEIPHYGIYEHALIAVLYAAQKEGVNLQALLAHAKNDTPGHPGNRPNPKDLHSVLQAIEHAINDVKRTSQ